jgi:acylpyruvate hydrolase
VNGEKVQHANTSQMIFDVCALIAHVSEWLPLEPGDVIATGTPSGVGLYCDPPRFLKPGDTVAVEIERLGRLENRVVDENHC